MDERRRRSNGLDGVACWLLQDGPLKFEDDSNGSADWSTIRNSQKKKKIDMKTIFQLQICQMKMFPGVSQ